MKGKYLFAWCVGIFGGTILGNAISDCDRNSKQQLEPKLILGQLEFDELEMICNFPNGSIFDCSGTITSNGTKYHLKFDEKGRPIISEYNVNLEK